jgi:hypothetical protein
LLAAFKPIKPRKKAQTFDETLSTSRKKKLFRESFHSQPLARRRIVSIARFRFFYGMMTQQSGKKKRNRHEEEEEEEEELKNALK